MKYVGPGCCDAAGYGSSHIPTYEECNQMCVDEPGCKHAAWFDNYYCARYNETDCHQKTDCGGDAKLHSKCNSFYLG